MTFTCKNKCVTAGMPYKDKYAMGYRYCRTCSTFIETEGFRCPCCNSLTRKSKRRAPEICPRIG